MSSSQSVLQPRTTKYEWGGPLGSIFMVILLPLLVLTLNSLCSGERCTVDDAAEIPRLLRDTYESGLAHLPRSLLIEVAWLAAHSVFYVLPMGSYEKGLPLRNGQVLSYRINAVHAFVGCHGVVFLLHALGVLNLAVLADMYASLMVASILITMSMSVVLYVASLRSERVLTAVGGNTGNAFYDFWVGRELNPRTWGIDWKFMCELRPGLIGWSILNWAFVAQAVQMNTLTPPIVLVALFQSLYVFDGLLMEVGIVSMMDITTDGFGFMLCFGDLTWVPFTYTLQTKYLAGHPAYLPPLYFLLVVVLIVVGYIIFRTSNTQKNLFRTSPGDPRVASLRVMKTSAGKSLIISGLWGVCRHPNYVGDWLMSVGWALLTGTSAVLPYFHPVYFGILLIHRQLRDEEHMLAKYGEKDWKRFCAIVRYRLIPYVY